MLEERPHEIPHLGDKDKPAVLLLPGACCHWKRNFYTVIPLLDQVFYVVYASYDGFDETRDTVFLGMLTETAKIEAYLNENLDGHIRVAYGCSVGGSFVGFLVQRGNVCIDHAILDSSDLDQDAPMPAKLKPRLVARASQDVPDRRAARLDAETPGLQGPRGADVHGSDA
jgi:hypothetical protein